VFFTARGKETIFSERGSDQRFLDVGYKPAVRIDWRSLRELRKILFEKDEAAESLLLQALQLLENGNSRNSKKASARAGRETPSRSGSYQKAEQVARKGVEEMAFDQNRISRAVDISRANNGWLQAPS
jgi:hypothetical protein